MTKQTASDRTQPRRRDPDLVGAEAAMARAAQKARERAWQSGAGVAVWKNGRVVEERPPAQVAEASDDYGAP